MSRATQCERLLNLLKSHEGQKVTLPRILDLRIANYRARLTELRRELWPQNYEIILFDERVGRERHTAYMLRRISRSTPSNANQISAWELCRATASCSKRN